jgi:putative ubiquitin-RnfH superfamily antitoxin RatB of RatAB toxin-antitoxin module
MHKLILVLLGGVIVISSSFINLNQPSAGLASYSQVMKADDVAKGLIEALQIGAEKSAAKASAVDGFYKNADIFIPFPKEAIKVKNALEKAGMKKQVTEFELSLNRAAEEASKKALPIMVEAIKGITFTDAMSILKGSNDAATIYLKEKTTSKLQVAFKPIVKEAISKVKVTKYWDNVANAYNKVNILSKGKKINPDLEAYITDKAIEGLFKLIAKEEEQIRDNPAARTTDLLKKIFK